MNLTTILFIITSQTVMAPTNDPTGVWLEEVTTPYYAFIDEGYNVEIATVAGGNVPIDPRSIGDEQKKEESVARYYEDSALQAAFKNTTSAEDIDIQKYDAVFFPGGHGTMWDYPNNPTLARIITEMLAAKKPVAAVCHGPAVFVGVENEKGEPLVRGKNITAFTDAEEAAVGLTEEVPFLLETRLRELGANVITVDNFQSHSIVDGLIVTGQNPASAKAVAANIIKLLEEK